MPSAAAVQDPRKENKYHNTPNHTGGPVRVVLHFDSQKEARRYDFLIERVRRGEIGDLRLQVDFTLQEAYTDAEGRRVRAIRYKADFTYRGAGQGPGGGGREKPTNQDQGIQHEKENAKGPFGN